MSFTRFWSVVGLAASALLAVSVICNINFYYH
jgi:hypothetical protein